MVEFTTDTKRKKAKTAAEIQKELMKKEAAVNLAFQSVDGLKKIAAALGNPVRKYLDYVPIGRQCAVVEPYPDGAPIYLDYDIDEWVAVKLAQDGSSNMMVIGGNSEYGPNRLFLDEFELTTRPKIPYRELRIRKYKVMDRVKQRLKQSIGIKEDLLWFALYEDAITTSGNSVSLAGADLTVTGMAAAFAMLEVERLHVENVIMNPYSAGHIRKWDRTEIDEAARIEIRQRGYLGNLWGANFYITNKIALSGTDVPIYLTSSPQLTAWMPIRADMEVIPADQPDNFKLGFNGYELLAMSVHNTRAVAKVVHKAYVV